MFLALYLTRSALAVCTFADPVAAGGAAHLLDVAADCYGTPGPPFDDEASSDTWVLALDATDVQQIIDGTCAVSVDNRTVAWDARARSSIGATHDKVLRREIDARLRVLSMTVYGATTVTRTPGEVSCSGEAANVDDGLVFQVPTSCPSGGADVLLADNTTESCTLEQVAPLLWTTLTTGSVSIPDLSADNLRDLLLVALADQGGCGAGAYPAVDITFEREVYGMASCASKVGNIEGQMRVYTPAAPTTVVAGAAALSCADAAVDLTVLDCEPTFESPETCIGTEPEIVLSPIEGLEAVDVADPADLQTVGPYVESAIGGISAHNGFDLMIPCDAGGTEPCVRAAPNVVAVASGTIVNLRSWPDSVSSAPAGATEAPGNIGFSILTDSGWLIEYNLETRIDCPLEEIPGDPWSDACSDAIATQLAALPAIDPADLAAWNNYLTNGGAQPAGIDVMEGDILGTFAGAPDGLGAHLHFGVACAGLAYCPSSFYTTAPAADVYTWFESCEADGAGEDCELNGATLDALGTPTFPLCH